MSNVRHQIAPSHIPDLPLPSKRKEARPHHQPRFGESISNRNNI
ncbi:hypothetical protein VDG1235_2551 [Verrucomicrobiia bacterium DG1235]|nr:hypothetical protein VDG1235_2551 [Verrucomicrobiae bacterium DG1235]